MKPAWSLVGISLPFLILTLLAACTPPPEATTEYVTNLGCSASSKDLYFSIANTGTKPLALAGSDKASDLLTMEVNNVELTGLANYCGRITLAPKEVAKCRRPGVSTTDAGVLIKTKGTIPFFKGRNIVRTSLSGETRELRVKCG